MRDRSHDVRAAHAEGPVAGGDSAKLIRSLMDHAPFPMSLRDLDGRFLVINRLGAELIGRTVEDVVGRTADELLDAETAAALESQESPVWQAGQTAVHEFAGRRPDGSIRDYLVTKYPVLDGSGQLLGLGGISIDITARKDVENQLREAEDRFRGAFDAAAIGMALVGADGRWLQVNRALCELVGYSDEELLAGTFQEITHPDDLEADLTFVARMLASEIQSYQMDKRYIHKLGHTIWIHLSVSLVRDSHGEPAYFVSQIQDISERRRAEDLAEQLRHSQKLDALGRLAGGVAHDFNNMLTAIKGYSQLLIDGLSETDPLRSPAEQISRAAEQAATLPRQLLAFSRKQQSQPEIVNVNEVVAASCDMLGHLLGDVVELEVLVNSETAHVLIDPSHIEQALVNLAVNASDAMPEGGTVTIETSSRRLDARTAGELGGRAGIHVVLSVADTGEGMDPETKAKVFDPFFTTKPTGTGLGLSTVYGVVRQCGGLIRVQSEPGEGSLFEIWLPQEPEAGMVEQAQDVEDIQASAGTVLLAEDEPLVRELAMAVLERSGYRVLPAATGEEALALYEERQGEIDVLVADMVMPGLGGRELAEGVLARGAQTRVVLMSGYTEDRPVIGHADLPRPIFPVFLQKPFGPTALLESVAESIDRPAYSRHVADRGAIATCVVADDHPAVLDAVSRYLGQNGFAILGQASTGGDALALIVREQPSIALLDVRMAGMSGIEVARRAAQVAPDTRIALFTGYSDRAMLDQALDAGARAFVLKETPLGELLRALTIVATGGTYVDPELADTLASSDTARALSPLTPREQEVLGLVADGMTNDKAAEALEISPETVQSHVRNAMGKLDADTRTQAVATAFRRSLLQ